MYFLLLLFSAKRVYVLVDARRGVMPIDQDFMDLLDAYQIPFQVLARSVLLCSVVVAVVFIIFHSCFAYISAAAITARGIQVIVTKIDTLSAGEYQATMTRVTAFQNLQRHAQGPPLPVSAAKNYNIMELRTEIARALALQPPKAYTAKFTPPPPLRVQPGKARKDEPETGPPVKSFDEIFGDDSGAVQRGAQSAPEESVGSGGGDGGVQRQKVDGWTVFVRTGNKKRDTASVMTVEQLPQEEDTDTQQQQQQQKQHVQQQQQRRRG